MKDTYRENNLSKTTTPLSRRNGFQTQVSVNPATLLTPSFCHKTFFGLW